MFQAAHVVLRAFGSRWTVPWTAETIVQVSLFALNYSLMDIWEIATR
jgi:hypothetical protein